MDSPWNVFPRLIAPPLLLIAALFLLAPAEPSLAQGIPFLHGGRLYSVRDNMVGAGFWDLGYEAVLGEDGTVVFLEELGKNTGYLSEKPYASTIVVRTYDARADRLGTARKIPAPEGHQIQQIALRGTTLYVAGIRDGEHFLGWVDISKEDATVVLMDAVPLLKAKPLDDLVVDGTVLYGIDDIVAPKWMVVYDLPSPTKPSLKGLVELRAGLNQEIVKAAAGPGYLAMLCRSVYRTGSALSVELYDKKTFASFGVIPIDARSVKGDDWEWQELNDAFVKSARPLLIISESLYVIDPDGGVGGVVIPPAWQAAASQSRTPVREMKKLGDGEAIPVYSLPDGERFSKDEQLSLKPVLMKTASGGMVPVYDLAYVPALAKFVAWREPGAWADLVTAADLILAADAGASQDKPVFVRELDRLPALISPKEGASLDSPKVTFTWSAVQGAAHYDIVATMNGSERRELVLLETSVPQTSYTAALDLGNQSTAGGKVFWSVRARYADDRVENWQRIAKFSIAGETATSLGVRQRPTSVAPDITPGYLPPRPNNQVTIAIESEPRDPAADGKTVVRVRAAVKDLSGSPVSKARVRFVLDGYHAREGHIGGANEELELDVPYQVIPSGEYIDGEKSSTSVDAFSDGQGFATVHYRVPQWADYMSDKPILLSVWYDCDGGGNPIAKTLMYFRKP